MGLPRGLWAGTPWRFLIQSRSPARPVGAAGGAIPGPIDYACALRIPPGGSSPSRLRLSSIAASWNCSSISPVRPRPALLARAGRLHHRECQLPCDAIVRVRTLAMIEGRPRCLAEAARLRRGPAGVRRTCRGVRRAIPVPCRRCSPFPTPMVYCSDRCPSPIEPLLRFTTSSSGPRLSGCCWRDPRRVARTRMPTSTSFCTSGPRLGGALGRRGRRFLVLRLSWQARRPGSLRPDRGDQRTRGCSGVPAACVSGIGEHHRHAFGVKVGQTR